MPVQYVELYSTLQDSIPQWPIEQALAIVRDSLQNELGLNYEDVFEYIDEVALGCASIGRKFVYDTQRVLASVEPSVYAFSD